MKYLLDSNIVSDMMHNPQGRCFQRISEIGEDNVFTSILVMAEIRFGVEKRQSQKLARRLSEILEALSVEKFEAPCDERYADIRVALEKAGRRSGQIDMLIAAHALARDATIVTANEKHFSHVPGLKMENWLR